MINKFELGRQINLKCHKMGVTEWGSPILKFERRNLREPKLLNEIANHMVELIPNQTEVLVGIGFGGIDVTKELAAKSGLPYFILHKEENNRIYLDGDISKMNHITLIDDTICNGRQIERAKNYIGLKVDMAVCIVKRGNRSDYLKIETRSLFTGEELNNIK